jgi:hypothetical protein
MRFRAAVLMLDRHAAASRLAPATRRWIATLALVRTSRYGRRTIATPSLVAGVPDKAAAHRPSI